MISFPCTSDTGRSWREPRERGYDRDYPERGGGRYDDYYDRERGGFDRPRTYSRSRSYDDEGDLPEWSTLDMDELEGGTFLMEKGTIA